MTRKKSSDPWQVKTPTPCRAKNRSDERLPIEVGACEESTTAACRFTKAEALVTADTPPAGRTAFPSPRIPGTMSP